MQLYLIIIISIWYLQFYIFYVANEHSHKCKFVRFMLIPNIGVYRLIFSAKPKTCLGPFQDIKKFLMVFFWGV